MYKVCTISIYTYIGVGKTTTQNRIHLLIACMYIARCGKVLFQTTPSQIKLQLRQRNINLTLTDTIISDLMHKYTVNQFSYVR